MNGLIDPPGAFASTDEWRAFIAELEKLPRSEERDVELAAAEIYLKGLEEAGGDPGETEDFGDLED